MSTAAPGTEAIQYVYVYNWNPCTIEPFNSGDYLIRHKISMNPAIVKFFKGEYPALSQWIHCGGIRFDITDCEWAAIPA